MSVRLGVWGFLLLAGLAACSAPGDGPRESASPSPTAAAASPTAPAGPDPLQAAQAALQGGNISAAQRFANQAVAERPESAEAHRVCSEVEFQAGNYDRALKEAKTAVDLTQGGSSAATFTLAKVQMFSDPDGALTTVRAMYDSSPNPGSAIMLADAILLDASARTPTGAAARQAAQEARKVLARHEEETKKGEFLGDHLSVLGNSYLLEGDLARARTALQASLDAGVGMPDRVTDLQNALAWIAFRSGDAAGAARGFDAALAELDKTGHGDAFLYLPKWESYHALRLAFTGKPASSHELRRREAVYRHLARRGYVDQLAFRMDRQLYLALFDAWERKDYKQAFVLLYPRAHPATVPEPFTSIATGSSEMQPNCFYRTTVEEPEHRLMAPMFLARIAQHTGQPALARFWYRRALELQPGNPIVRKLLAGVPAQAGEPPEDLGGPTPEESVRILQRFAREGWANPLLEGMQVLQSDGVTQAEMERMLTDSQAIVTVLDRAVAALDRGEKFVVTKGDPGRKPGKSENDPAVWGWARAELPLGDGGEPLVLHLDVRLWYVTQVPRTTRG